MTRVLAGLLALVVILTGLSAWLIFKGNPWKTRATTAETQAGLNGETGAIADKAGVTTARIIIQSEAKAHEVETAPGGDAPIPPAVHDGWDNAINGMRQRPAANPADHTAQLAG